MTALPSIGFIGAGHIGGTLSKVAVSKGHHVVISNSRGPDSLKADAAKLGDLAKAGTTAEAIACDIVVVTIPLKALQSLPQDKFAGKIVIDTNNYYPGRDGQFPELDNNSTTSSEILAKHLAGAKIVKAFNTIWFQHITEHALLKGDPNRRALPIAGDDLAAKKTVTALIDSFGFDVLDIGSLSHGHRIQPDTPSYNKRETLPQLSKSLGFVKGVF